jgi:DNA-binding transcriptional MerR regulator
METLTIKEAAQFIGLTVHTLRYYERIGLLEPVSRKKGGHRQYLAEDLERLRFLSCLRKTGMPIRRLREYAALTQQGRKTLDARLEILETHKRDVQTRISELEEAVSTIDAKVQRFQKARKGGKK